MGMDVYGTNPSDQKGEYFRANVWFWRPLWGLVEDLYSEYAEKVPNAHYNDGDGLNSEDSYALALLFKRDIENGTLESYVDEYEKARSSIPKEPCSYCSQTGHRLWPQDDGSVLQKLCNVCQGSLEVDNFASHYPMHIEVVKEFQQFLEHCGGFQIH